MFSLFTNGIFIIIMDIKRKNVSHTLSFQCKPIVFSYNACADPEGGHGSGPPLEKITKIYIGPIPLKITKLPSQYSTLDHNRLASEMPFKWRFACGPMMARLL